MADYKELCHTTGSQKWLKCWMAIYITRGGILPLVREQMTDLHKAFLDIIEKEGLPTCSSCCTPNVFNCPTRGLCYVKNGHCNFHSAPELMYKFCKAHDRFKTEIEKQNRFKPFWTNSKAEKWFSSPLELAKCFLPKGEYSGKESFDELDLNGLLALIINCKAFEKLFQANMSDQTNVCTEVRDLVNKIRHFETIDIPITDDELQDIIDNMIRLLNDPMHLCKREGVLGDLKQLKGDTLFFSTRDNIKCIEEAYKSIDATNSKALEYIKKDITEKLEAAKKEVESITDKSLSKVREERDTTIAAIEGLREQAFADIEKRSKKQDERDQLSETNCKEKTDYLEEFACAHTPKEHIDTEFQRKLIDYLERNHTNLRPVPLIPERNVPLDTLYVNPEVITTSKTDNHDDQYSQANINTTQLTRNTSKTVDSFRNIFFRKDIPVELVYLIGEPGTGKTSFCSKIVSTWCKVQRAILSNIVTEPSLIENEDDSEYARTTFLDENTLSYFEFLFCLSLGCASDNECDISDMIINQIALELPGREKYDRQYIDRILTSKRALVLLDGLDEFKHPQFCRRKQNILPHFIQTKNMTVLISSRPWKAPLCSQIDQENGINLILKGISYDSIRSLVYKVTRLLNKSSKTQMIAEEFIRTVFEKELFGLSVPLVTVLMVSIWHDNRTFTDSRCVMYSEMFDMLIERDQGATLTRNYVEFHYSGSNMELDRVPCLQNKPGMRRHSTLLFSLAKLAFYTLIDTNQESAVVFQEGIVEKFFSVDQCQKALEMGIISRHTKIVQYRKHEHKYHFLHKTFQEYLAALFLALECDSKTSIEHITKTLRTVDYILSFEDMFVFLCGLSPSCASCLLEQFNKQIWSFPFDFDCHRRNVEIIQTFVVSGYIEGKKCNSEMVSLPLHNILLGQNCMQDNMVEFYELVKVNRNNFQSITISCFNKISCIADGTNKNVTTQQSLFEPTDFIFTLPNLKAFAININDFEHPSVRFLDLSNCSQLEHVQIKGLCASDIKLNLASLRSLVADLKVKEVLPNTIFQDCVNLEMFKIEETMLKLDITHTLFMSHFTSRHIKCLQLDSFKFDSFIDLRNSTAMESLTFSNCISKGVKVDLSNLVMMKLVNTNSDITTDVFRSLSNGCTKLETLIINDIDLQLVTDHYFKVESQRLKNIIIMNVLNWKTSLEVSFVCEAIDLVRCDLDVLDKIDCANKASYLNVFINTIAFVSALQRLSNVGSMIEYMTLTSLNETTIGPVKFSLPRLNSLYVFNCGGRFDFSSCNNLRECNIFGLLGGRTTCTLNSENLEKLHIANATKTRIPRIMNKLKSLEIEACSGLNEIHVDRQFELASITLTVVRIKNVQFHSKVDLTMCCCIKDLQLYGVNCTGFDISTLCLRTCTVDRCCGPIVKAVLKKLAYGINSLEDISVSCWDVYVFNKDIIGTWPQMATLSFYNLSFDGCLGLVQCHNLKTVILCDVSVKKLKIVECKTLSHVSVASNSYIGQTYGYKLNTPKSMCVELVIQFLREISIERVSLEILKVFLSALQNTDHRFLNNLRLSCTPEFITPTFHNSLDVIKLNCPRLKTISLQDIRYAVEIRMDGCTGLNKVNFSNVYLKGIKLESTRLKWCELNNCSNTVVETIVNSIINCRTVYIEHLSITGCHDLHLNSKKILCENMQDLKLIRTSLKDCMVSLVCPNILNVIIDDLSGKVEIICGNNIKEMTVKTSDVCLSTDNVHHLITCKICFASNIKLVPVLSSSHLLESLKLSGCNFTSSEVYVIECPNLRSFDLLKCNLIVGIVIKANLLRFVSMVQSTLRYLEVASTDDSVRFIADNFSCDQLSLNGVSLEHCSVKDCSRNVLIEAISTMQKISNKLQTCTLEQNKYVLDVDDNGCCLDIKIQSNNLTRLNIQGLKLLGNIFLCSNNVLIIKLKDVYISGQIDFSKSASLRQLYLECISAQQMLLNSGAIMSISASKINSGIIASLFSYIGISANKEEICTDKQVQEQNISDNSKISCYRGNIDAHWERIEIQNIDDSKELRLNANTNVMQMHNCSFNGCIALAPCLEVIMLENVTIRNMLDLHSCDKLKQLYMDKCIIDEIRLCQEMPLNSCLISSINTPCGSSILSQLQTSKTSIQKMSLMNFEITVKCCLNLHCISQMKLSHMKFAEDVEMTLGKELSKLSIFKSNFHQLHLRSTRLQSPCMDNFSTVTQVEHKYELDDLFLLSNLQENTLDIQSSTFSGNSAFIGRNIQHMQYFNVIIDDVLNVKDCKNMLKLEMSFYNQQEIVDILSENLAEVSIYVAQSCDIVHNTFTALSATNTRTKELKLTSAYRRDAHICTKSLEETGCEYFCKELSVSLPSLSICKLSNITYCGRLKLLDTTLKEFICFDLQLSDIRLQTNTVETCIIQNSSIGVVEGVILSLSKRSENLRKLEISNTEIHEERTVCLRTNGNIQLVCPVLECFTVKYEHIGNGVLVIAEQLTVLDIRFTTFNGSFDLSLCKNLKRLTIFACAANCVEVNNDSIECCSILRNNSVAVLSGIVSSLKEAPNLKMLQIQNTGQIDIAVDTVVCLSGKLKDIKISHLTIDEFIDFSACGNLVAAEFINVNANRISLPSGMLKTAVMIRVNSTMAHDILSSVTSCEQLTLDVISYGDMPIEIHDNVIVRYLRLKILHLTNIKINGKVDLKHCKKLQEIFFTSVVCEDITLSPEKVEKCYLKDIPPIVATKIVNILLSGALKISVLDLRNCGISEKLTTLIDVCIWYRYSPEKLSKTDQLSVSLPNLTAVYRYKYRKYGITTELPFRKCLSFPHLTAREAKYVSDLSGRLLLI